MRQCWWFLFFEFVRVSGSLYVIFLLGGKFFEYFEKCWCGEGGGGLVGDFILVIGELLLSCLGNDFWLEEYVNCKNWSLSQEIIDWYKVF